VVEIDYLYIALINAAPIMLAAYGELFLERCGRVNLGVDGIMAFGASVGVLAASIAGDPGVGLLASALSGLAISALYIAPAVVLKIDQIVSGLLLVFIGWGLADLVAGLGHRISPGIAALSPHQIVVLLISILTPIALWLLLYRTWAGVEIRAIGYDEQVARDRGMRVDLIRGVAAAIGGALAGVAGGYMALALYNGKYFTGITGGWGWLAIGSVILGYWHPLGVAAASYTIGALLTLRPYLEGHGLGPLSASTPYIAVIVALVVASYLSRRPGLRPPKVL